MASSIEEFDLRYYDPKSLGLKDLVFEMRISHLDSFIKDDLKLSKVEDVHFKIYWVFPNVYEVEVNGLPKGFIQIKRRLKQIARTYIEFVVAKKLSERTNGYQLKTTKKGEEISVMAIDKTYSKEIHEMKMNFDRKGKLKKLRILSPAGLQVLKFVMSSKPWSHNKWAIDELESENTQIDQTKVIIKKKFVYKKIGQFGFPITIMVETRSELIHTAGRKGNNQAVSSIISFKNYVINEDLAKKYMAQLNSRR